MAVLKINNVIMPTPNKLTVARSDLSSSESGRTLAGKMLKDIVATKTTISCSWSVLNWEECSILLSAVESTGAFMNVTYPDPKTGNYATKTCYVGDRTAPALQLLNGKEMWEGVAFDFIEQ